MSPKDDSREQSLLVPMPGNCVSLGQLLCFYLAFRDLSADHISLLALTVRKLQIKATGPSLNCLAGILWISIAPQLSSLSFLPSGLLFINNLVVSQAAFVSYFRTLFLEGKGVERRKKGKEKVK